MRPIFTILFLSSFLLPACATGRNNPYLHPGPDKKLTKKESAAIEKQLQKLWPLRHESASLARWIELSKSLGSVTARPGEQWVQLARAEFLWAEYHAPDRQSRLSFFLSAAHRAEAVLALSPAYHEAISRPKARPEDGAETLQRADANALHWFAESLYRWSVESGVTTELKHRRTVKSLFRTLETLSPGHHFGAADRHAGIEHARSPSGDPEELALSRQRFEAAMKTGPAFPGNAVAYARYYARAAGDETLFSRLLEGVISANPASVPKDLFSELILEQKRAKALLNTKREP
jgi:hypothetical protein